MIALGRHAISGAISHHHSHVPDALVLSLGCLGGHRPISASWDCHSQMPSSDIGDSLWPGSVGLQGVMHYCTISSNVFVLVYPFQC